MANDCEFKQTRNRSTCSMQISFKKLGKTTCASTPKLGAEVGTIYLQDDCFGDHAYFRCLVTEAISDADHADKAERGTVVGYAMYFCAYSAWIGKLMYLEDLFIQPAHRGQGLGKALVCKVAQIGSEKGCKGMQWVVQDSNNSARQFYNRLDAVDMTATDGWRVMGLRGENFSHVANSLTNLETNNIQWLC